MPISWCALGCLQEMGNRGLESRTTAPKQRARQAHPIGTLPIVILLSRAFLTQLVAMACLESPNLFPEAGLFPPVIYDGVQPWDSCQYDGWDEADGWDDGWDEACALCCHKSRPFMKVI